MQEIYGLMLQKAQELLENNKAEQVLAWKNGEFVYDKEPTAFLNAKELEDFKYDSFCGANLCKYLINESEKGKKTAVFLKPCDTYGLNELLSEHRVKRENVYAIGIACDGMVDINKVKKLGIKGIKSVEDLGEKLKFQTIYGEKECNKNDVLLEKCLCCKGKKHMIADEVIGEVKEDKPIKDRFADVKKLEAMTPDERFEFWRNELSKCIRCNACRNVCPVCNCTKCVFDNDKYGVEAKANNDTFEENMFHIIRAFHVAGRCTDCGECSRVCPQNIPLHLLNRKFISDINELYGEYQAGLTDDCIGPLTNYDKDDAEPSIVHERGGKK